MDASKKKNVDNSNSVEKRNQEIKAIHKKIDDLFTEMDREIEKVKAQDYNANIEELMLNI